MIELIIKFVTTYNDVIIAVLGALVLILTALAVYFTYFHKVTPEKQAERDLGDIEDSLKKLILEIHKTGGTAVFGAETAAGGANAGMTAATKKKKAAAGKSDKKSDDLDASSTESSEDAFDTEVNASAGGADPEVITALQKELEKKKSEVESLKNRVTDNNLDNTSELLGKIKLLEQRLAEYAIIEDDIADLSIFKEENIRLKDELEKMKGGAPAVATELLTEVPAEVAAPAPVAEAAPVAETEPAEAPELSNEELMAEFDAASKKLKAEESPEPSADEPSPDIFAEFSGDESSEDPLGDFDPDKMLQELHGIQGSGSADVVKEKSDMNKMADEAKKL